MKPEYVICIYYDSVGFHYNGVKTFFFGGTELCPREDSTHFEIHIFSFLLDYPLPSLD